MSGPSEEPISAAIVDQAASRGGLPGFGRTAAQMDSGATSVLRADGSAAQSDPSEAELVERLKAFDDGAIRQVYRLYANAIYRFALYQSGDSILAEDVAGEVFVRMMESIGTYTYRGAPISAWLYRIARNLVVDHQRRGSRFKPLDGVQEGRFVSENPVEMAERQLGWEELRGVMGELTDEQRQVIVLKFVEDLPNHEVAEIIGKTEGSVKSLQHRALRSLKRLLERQGGHAD